MIFKTINLKKISLGLLILLLLAFVVFYILMTEINNKHSNMQIEIKPNNTYDTSLVVVADIDYEPYSFYDNNKQISGCDVEFIYALANEMKMNVEVKLMPWVECKKAILDGSADLILGIEPDTDSGNQFIYSAAIHSDQFVCFGKRDFASVSQLYNKKLATLDESGSLYSFLQPYNLVNNTAFYPSYTEAFQSVIDDENDYVIVRYSVGRRLQAKLQDDTVRLAGPIITNNSMCIGMRHDKPELLSKVNKATEKLLQDGTMDKLNDKWFGNYVELISYSDFLYIYRNWVFGFVATIVFAFFAALFYSYIKKAKAFQAEYEFTEKMLEYQRLIGEATKGLYENIYEIDITHNKILGEMRHFLESIGIDGDTPCDQALRCIAKRQIQEEYVDGYLATFLPEHVLEAYNQGITNLTYDFLNSSDGENYYWLRITARIFFWNADKSVRMIAYRQNIDKQKKHEKRLLEEARRDSLTGIYNKATTESMIRDFLENEATEGGTSALLMADIDNFKYVNDGFGHAFGDFVIKEFVSIIRMNFRETDIIGRVGGDEFMVLIKNIPNGDWIQQKLERLNEDLAQEFALNNCCCNVSASIGVALYPDAADNFEELYEKADQALYKTKSFGKNGNFIYGND